MAIKDYAAYTAQELALDERFQQWVLHPEATDGFWTNWCAANPEKAADVALAITLVQGIGFKPYVLAPAEKDQLWDTLWEHMGEEEHHPAINTTTTYIPAWYKRAWKYAAALLIGVAAATGWLLLQPKATGSQTLALHTAYGETKTCYLPDSTAVTLNANTRLLYTATDTSREVWMDGEAYFNVQHEKGQRPFSVHTYDKVSVAVLGTAFTVSSMGEKVKVVLEEGSVRLHIGDAYTKNEHILNLRPSEMLTYDKISGAFTKTTIVTSMYTAWQKGRLEMDNYTLADAAQFMQQVFGQHLVVADRNLLQRRISGSMPIVYNADTMLLQLGRVFKVKADRNGDNVWISR